MLIPQTTTKTQDKKTRRYTRLLPQTKTNKPSANKIGLDHKRTATDVRATWAALAARLFIVIKVRNYRTEPNTQYTREKPTYSSAVGAHFLSYAARSKPAKMLPRE